MLSDSGTCVSHNPTANAKMGEGIARVRDLIDAGIVVGLGHDSTEGNNTNDLFDVMRTAAYLQRASRVDPASLSADEVLAMATRNGARALDVDAGIVAPGRARRPHRRRRPYRLLRSRPGGLPAQPAGAARFLDEREPRRHHDRRRASRRARRASRDGRRRRDRARRRTGGRRVARPARDRLGLAGVLRRGMRHGMAVDHHTVVLAQVIAPKAAFAWIVQARSIDPHHRSRGQAGRRSGPLLAGEPARAHLDLVDKDAEPARHEQRTCRRSD